MKLSQLQKRMARAAKASNLTQSQQDLIVKLTLAMHDMKLDDAHIALARLCAANILNTADFKEEGVQQLSTAFHKMLDEFIEQLMKAGPQYDRKRLN